MTQKVLVVCTGNSCRSIMAEALINHLRGDRCDAVSAGSEPTGTVHPRALDTLRRHGIEPGPVRSKSWDEFAGEAFDCVITVCDAAAAETCPAFAGRFRRLHWSTPDPAAARGTDETLDAAFEGAFAALRNRIEKEL